MKPFPPSHVHNLFFFWLVQPLC